MQRFRQINGKGPYPMYLLITLIFAVVTVTAQDEIKFSCYPMNPPMIQGEEKFLKLNFRNDGHLEANLYGMSGNVVDLSRLANLKNAFYTHDSTTASATWMKDGNPFAQLSLAYFGSWWGGILRTHAEIDLGTEKVRSDFELEFRCREVR